MKFTAFETPLEITPIEGEVAITGPDGFAGSLTPDAATKSARRLLKAVEQLTGTPAAKLLSEDSAES